MLRITLLSFLWIYGLLPTAISLLMVIAMAGKPQKCERPGCTARTYGWELLVLPAATASPFIAGFYLAQISALRKERLSKAIGGKSET